MTDYSIIALRDHPEMHGWAARWFHEKWRIPTQAYLDSMAQMQKSGVPQWYLALGVSGEILGGLGVIENDFHKRKDLAPNICAVYVQERARGMGLARTLLDHACAEMAQFGLENIYLVTTHTAFYEHCAFEFFCMAEEDDGGTVRVYHRKLKREA